MQFAHPCVEGVNGMEVIVVTETGGRDLVEPPTTTMATLHYLSETLLLHVVSVPHLFTAVIDELGVGDYLLIRWLYHGRGFYSADYRGFSVKAKTVGNFIHDCKMHSA